ncbi:MAG: hypothetical protein ACKOUT_03865 [Novosphingobium sp.]
MESITIDGQHEDAFRQSIEDMLRRGLADDAAKHLRTLLQPFTGEGAPFPARFMAVSYEDIEISGWEELDEGLKKFDRAEQPVTGICLSFGDPEGRAPVPDGAGLMSLTVETAYFSDEAFPFSESDRNDLLDGYSSFGCQWAGDCEGVDHAIAFRGVDDLYGALAVLEQRLLSSESPDPDEIRAGTIASCYLSVLFHKALRDNFAKRRMGRPLCVLTANNGVYPSFDAPVLSCDEYLAGGEVVAVAAATALLPVDQGSVAPAHAALDDEEGAEEASLLSIGIKRSAKKLALALAEGDDDNGMDAMASAALGGIVSPVPADPFDYRPYLEQEQPVEDVFDDPASFSEIPVEHDPAPPEPVAVPEQLAAEALSPQVDELEAQPEAIAEVAPIEPASEAVPVELADPVETPVAADRLDPELAATSLDTADAAEIPELTEALPEPEHEAEAQRTAQPARVAHNAGAEVEGYKPWSVGSDHERQMGDTIWPEREENPAVRAEDISPFEPEVPRPPAPRHTYAPQAGHSLRARISNGGDSPASEPAEVRSAWTKFVDTVLGLIRRR